MNIVINEVASGIALQASLELIANSSNQVLSLTKTEGKLQQL